LFPEFVATPSLKASEVHSKEKLACPPKFLTKEAETSMKFLLFV
jgi:hypothetical protein